MTTVHSEREAKFEGTGRFDPEDFRKLPAVEQVREEEPEELDAIYYDTPDLRLLTHDVTLRRRSGGHDEGWHVKLPAGDGARTEVHAPLRAGKPGDVPEELRRRVVAYARGRDLVPVAHLRTHRRRHTLLGANADPLAEVAQDSVAAQSLEHVPAARGGAKGTGTTITKWFEIEVELEDGDADLLPAAARRLKKTGWRRSTAGHKVDRALADRLAAVTRQRPPAACGKRGPDAKALRKGSAGDAVMTRFREQLTELLQVDPGVRVDEPDALHRMRSAARRLRNLLRSQRRVLDRSRTEPVARELHWLTAALAEARDHEVLAERLHDQAALLRAEEHAPRAALKGLAGRVRDQERARHDVAWREVLALLDGPRYFALLDALDNLAADPPLRRGRAAKPAVKQARKAAERDRRRLEKRLAAERDAPAGREKEKALHGVRKAARRLRHCAEAAEPYGGKRARRLRKRARAVQKLLGGHQDAVVARRALLPLAAEAHSRGADTFGYGLLFAVQQRTLDDARHALPQASRRVTAPKLTRFP
ncbi:CYTH and CHAD domain-containing protein [Actinacidiphila acidipaludis]|uniref:CYTH and CHAD domain-containing protein n=1 Tax=Actinacidiphila acidipaludis TaxID=2873382 RepID=A0ABS7Q0F6_9ACTN|nr:CYTH and CHAD domain-containing protein [Streptomyces acidipaludis]MBY8876376.1 CYTH and CHAD domain-containing protein [Streptomyces acidipaludis]